MYRVGLGTADLCISYNNSIVCGIIRDRASVIILNILGNFCNNPVCDLELVLGSDSIILLAARHKVVAKLLEDIHAVTELEIDRRIARFPSYAVANVVLHQHSLHRICNIRIIGLCSIKYTTPDSVADVLALHLVIKLKGSAGELGIACDSFLGYTDLHRLWLLERCKLIVWEMPFTAVILNIAC